MSDAGHEAVSIESVCVCVYFSSYICEDLVLNGDYRSEDICVNGMFSVFRLILSELRETNTLLHVGS